MIGNEQWVSSEQLVCQMCAMQLKIYAAKWVISPIDYHYSLDFSTFAVVHSTTVAVVFALQWHFEWGTVICALCQPQQSALQRNNIDLLQLCLHVYEMYTGFNKISFAHGPICSPRIHHICALDASPCWSAFDAVWVMHFGCISTHLPIMIYKMQLVRFTVQYAPYTFT